MFKLFKYLFIGLSGVVLLITVYREVISLITQPVRETLFMIAFIVLVTFGFFVFDKMTDKD